MNAAGVLHGVDMTASATTGTLTVGVIGGPEMDIFTLNNPPAAGAVAVSTAASSQGNIVFNSSSTVFGAIGVTQPGGPFLRNITGGNNGTVVNFQGPVFATTTIVNGTGTMNFNSGSNNITATIFAGDGVISLAPNTTLIGAMTTTAGAQTGTLSLGGGSVLNGAVGGAIGLRAINVVGGSNLAGVTSTVTGAVDAYTFNLGTNTLNVGGALTIANGGAGGVINTTLASPTVYGNIRPTGTTNLGPTLAINVTVPTTAFIPIGTQFNLAQTRLGTVQSGTNGTVLRITVVDPTNPLYTFSAVPPAGTVAGLVAIRTTGVPLQAPLAPPPGVALPPNAPIGAPIVPILLNFPNPPPDVVRIITAINALSNINDVANALAQLAPSNADLAAPLVTFEGSREFQNLLTAHLYDDVCGQVSQPLDPSQDQPRPSICSQASQLGGAWAKGFGYFGDQGAQGPFNGYTSGTYGTMVGYDAPIDRETRVGLGVGYAWNTIDGKVFSATSNFSTYQGTAYITHEHGPWFVNGDLSFGWNDYAETRNIMFPGINLTANGKYSGQTYSAFATAGYHLFAGGFTLTPLGALQYTHMNLGSYSESGAGSVNLLVDSQSYDFVESRLGMTLAHPFAVSTGALVPEGHFNWLRELANPTIVNTAAFAFAPSEPFSTPGLKNAADTFNVGAGLTFLSCGCTARKWSVEAVYDYDWRMDHYSAQQARVKLTASF